MNRIKTIILAALKLACVIFALVLVNRLFMPKYINENQDGRVTQEYYKEKLDTDVIFVGSSTVYSAISPVELWNKYGITSYDRGNSSQTLWISYYMIEDAIKYNKPELVVLDTGFIKYSDDYAEEAATQKSLDGMRWSKSKIDCINESMSENEKFIEYVFPLFRFHSRWKELTKDDYQYVFYNGKVSHNGQLINKNKTEYFELNSGYADKSDTKLGERNLAYLDKIINLCLENDVQIMLMKVPSNSDNWSYDYDRQIEIVASKYDVSYTNFDDLSDEIGLDYLEDSPDKGSHLNSYGAVKFSDYLGNYIVNHYTISKHNDDEKYILIWDKKTEEYNNEFLGN